MRLEMFCGRSRIPSVKIANKTTTAMRARKIPFLPRSAKIGLRAEVNRLVGPDPAGFVAVSVM
jgi:hypothetical protein